MSTLTLLRHAPVLALALFLSACASAPQRSDVAAAPALSVPAHDNLHATLWMQTSAEYEATVRGVFAQARWQLDRALADPSWDALPPSERPIGSGFESLPPAVIVDADETMIDNSAFQARGIRDDQTYTLERWTAWSNERRARAIPGAREFARYAADRGVAVYFVTNRVHASELDATADNLLALGFPVESDRSNLLLAGDPRAAGREKSERRAWVAARHRVLLMLGDNLGDFIDGVSADVATRARRMSAYNDWWGERWLMLPNPAYGGWESALAGPCEEEGAQRERRACLHDGLRMD